MNNAIFTFDSPQNEPILQYGPGSKERDSIQAELKRLSSETIEIPLIIGGKEVRTGTTGNVVMPHDHSHVLATYHQAGEKEIGLAIEAALKAKSMWENISWIECSSIMLRVAELLSVKYRDLIVASTMLGQDKSVYQAEIDAACEVIDYLRYNVFFASQIYGEHPSRDSDS
jgi:1-pyrroline-5-carboxylate dehydrogenase